MKKELSVIVNKLKQHCYRSDLHEKTCEIYNQVRTFDLDEDDIIHVNGRILETILEDYINITSPNHLIDTYEK